MYLASLVEKMALNITPPSKKEKRKDRDRGRRVNTFGMEYVQTKYPKIYNETMEFHDKLRELYPEKYDLRKTVEFKHFKLQQEKEGQQPQTLKPPAMVDNLQLRIPLWDKATLSSTQSLETVAEEVLGEGTIYPSLQDEIPNELIEKILEELREDPDLKDIFNIVEADFEQLGADIDIDEDIRLENELVSW